MAKVIARRIRELEDAARNVSSNDPNRLIPFPSIAPDGSRCIAHKAAHDATDDELHRTFALYKSAISFSEWLAGAEVDCSPEAMSGDRGKLSGLLAIRDGNTC